MKGYIYLETHPDYPGQIRILSQEQAPSPERVQAPTRMHYIARFRNAHIGYMHVHNTLKRRLEDLNERRYSATLAEAIAAIEAEDLAVQGTHLD
ncbi:MAG: hypothetical protein R3E89_18385 [Thiolinea sp.]